MWTDSCKAWEVPGPITFGPLECNVKDGALDWVFVGVILDSSLLDSGRGTPVGVRGFVSGSGEKSLAFPFCDSMILVDMEIPNPSKKEGCASDSTDRWGGIDIWNLGSTKRQRFILKEMYARSPLTIRRARWTGWTSFGLRILSRTPSGK